MKINTPCHIIDLDRLNENIQKLSELKKKSDCSILMALKGMSTISVINNILPYIDGMHASSLYESKLSHDVFKKYTQIYSPAYSDEQMDYIISYNDSIILNSMQQISKYKSKIKSCNKDCGIRVNIQFSEISVHTTYNKSRLGIPLQDIKKIDISTIDGLHVHCMCENQADTLDRLVDYLIDNLDIELGKVKWLNLGGGELIGDTRFDIDIAANAINRLKDKYNIKIFIEPCEGILAECGYFATRVLDILHNNIAILDSSPICHMPDSVYRGWGHDKVGEDKLGKYIYELTGISCFVDDTFGKARFSKPLKEDDIIYFRDTATYNMVKQNNFNGIADPFVYLYSKNKGLQLVKRPSYNSFMSRL